MSASLLLHLIQFSRQLILVLDEETNLILNVQEALKQQGLTVHARSGPELPSPQSWVELLEHLLDMPYARQTLLETRLRNVLNKITKRTEPLVLLITQAETLSLEVFAVLLSLAEQNLTEQGALRLILFGAEGLHERLQDSALAKRYEAVSYVISNEEKPPKTSDLFEDEHIHPTKGEVVYSLKWHWIGALGITALLVTVFANIQLQLLSDSAAKETHAMATNASTTISELPMPTEEVTGPLPPLLRLAEQNNPPPHPGSNRHFAPPPPSDSRAPGAGSMQNPPPPPSGSQPVPDNNMGSHPMPDNMNPPPPAQGAQGKPHGPNDPAGTPPTGVRSSSPQGSEGGPRNGRPKGLSALPKKPFLAATPKESAVLRARPYSWQIASLKTEDKAKALLKKHPGLKIVVVGKGNQKRFQIFAGPFQNKELAMAAKKKLHPELLALNPWLRKLDSGLQLAKK